MELGTASAASRGVVRVPEMPELSRNFTIILLAIIVAGIILGLATDIGLFGFAIAAIAALVWIAMAMSARRRAV
jgi:Na+/H+-translocating membrane pyrophosphatase